ncbi:hypothetical protein ES319_A02G140600v1 [Gossypium barbadense]|uniref:Epidermal patterning factor-like protein n=1 Tax=Gossypium barbadense TaxID=3634 RepID=A0A5J5WQ04_GOSBA|nr:hypothetical protein ES319_A02G140600v1 [Gossypium barbadense]
MTSLVSPLLNTFTFLLPLSFLLLSSPTSSLVQGLYFEDKTRLGSTPPSCHNRCNGCHPCKAVQVPTTPLLSHYHQFQPPGSSKAITNPMEVFYPSSGSQYSNYKPLGWKCHCDDQFYNP